MNDHGVIFRPDLATRIERVVDWAERRMTTTVPGATTAELPLDTVAVYNDSGVDADRYDCLHLAIDYNADGVLTFTRPESPYLRRLGIAAAPIPAGETGRAWVRGVHPVRCADWASLTDALFPFLACTQIGSFLVRRHFGQGQVVVHAKHATSPLVYAEIAA